MKHIGLFAAGVLFGTAGLKLLGSKDAKKVYAHTTAAAIRAKDCVMKAVTNVREGARDRGRTGRRSVRYHTQSRAARAALVFHLRGSYYEMYDFT